MKALLVLALALLFASPAFAADLVYKQGDVTATLTDKPCDVPQVIEAKKSMPVPPGDSADNHLNKNGSLVGPLGVIRFCWCDHDGVVFILDQDLDDAQVPKSMFKRSGTDV